MEIDRGGAHSVGEGRCDRPEPEVEEEMCETFLIYAKSIFGKFTSGNEVIIDFSPDVKVLSPTNAFLFLEVTRKVEDGRILLEFSLPPHKYFNLLSLHYYLIH